MFTGIVQVVGAVRSIRDGSSGAHVAVAAPELARPISSGASISVSGVCLTVTTSDSSIIEFDVVPETLSRTTLGSLTPGSRVNLERSLRAGDPMDGHVVQGHVDGRARVARIDTGSGGHVVWFEPDPTLMAFVIPKGSIAVDGVSLTVAAVRAGAFSTALIPTTLAVTTLGGLRVGDGVNIETDILTRTIVATLQGWREATGTSGLTLDKLRQEGFVT